MLLFSWQENAVLTNWLLNRCPRMLNDFQGRKSYDTQAIIHLYFHHLAPDNTKTCTKPVRNSTHHTQIYKCCFI